MIAAILFMTVGVFAWGLIANMHSTTAFHGYSGPMHTTAFALWMGTLCVFAASNIIALRSLSPLLTPVAE
jgi:hypothetical protein